MLLKAIEIFILKFLLFFDEKNTKYQIQLFVLSVENAEDLRELTNFSSIRGLVMAVERIWFLVFMRKPGLKTIVTSVGLLTLGRLLIMEERSILREVFLSKSLNFNMKFHSKIS